jgi:TolA-binding protein
MKAHRLLLLMALLPLTALPARAQEPGPLAVQDGGAPEERPLDRLMEVRQELGLTDPQMARLQQIALRLEETNRPLRQELLRQWQALREQKRQELLRMPPAERQAEIQRIRQMGHLPPTPAMQQLAEQIRGNIRGAMREAGGVLTPGQKRQVREMMRARREARMGGGGLGARRGRFGGLRPRARP